MASPLARIIDSHIFKVPARRKNKPVVNPSDIPTFHYTAHLADVMWLRRAARRKANG